MIRLFYVSTAANELNAAEIAAIAETSAEQNAKNDITGALGYRDGVFGQVLEGEPEAVERLMAKIAADDRHSGVIEVARISVDDRAFYDWGMKRLDGPSFNDLLGVMLDPV